MNNSIELRKFEERDIDFIFRCKNDEKINSMIVGHHNYFSFEDSVTWVHNCMKGDRIDLKYWAICTNDQEQRIIGWVCLSEIDHTNKSACHNGIVISDKEYNDGYAMFEVMLMSMVYAFEDLSLNRLYGYCLSCHSISSHLLLSLGFTLEGKRRESIYRNGKYLDVSCFSILQKEYFEYKNEGDYKLNKLVNKFVKSKKTPK